MSRKVNSDIPEEYRIGFDDLKRWIKEAKTDTRKHALYGYMTCQIHNGIITDPQWRELKKLFKFTDKELNDIMIIQ